MKPNPVLRKLGLAETDRAVIIHADDIGVCQASTEAYADLVDFELISSGAVMVPCPWFPAVGAFCRQHPQVDLGVHTTFTCEYDVYRWGPISTRDPGSGLLDAEGYFYRTTPEAQKDADPAAVAVELEAQVVRALAAGIDVTHLDTHMGTVAHAKFFPSYVQVGLKYGIPPMIPRMEVIQQRSDADPETQAALSGLVKSLEERGMPVIDNIKGMPLDQPESRLEQVKQALASLPPGITHFIIHPSKDTPELRAIAPDWRSRVADYQTFTSEELRKFVRDYGLHVIGYRALREVMRANVKSEA